MIYNDKGKAVKRLTIDGREIKSAYVYHDGSIRKVFGSSKIYYGFYESKDTTPSESGMTSTPVRYNFGPITATPPEIKPMPGGEEQIPKNYFYMYIPASIASHVTFYLNDMACTPNEAGRGRTIDGEEYICYRFGEKQHGTIKIEGRYE